MAEIADMARNRETKTYHGDTETRRAAKIGKDKPQTPDDTDRESVPWHLFGGPKRVGTSEFPTLSQTARKDGPAAASGANGYFFSSGFAVGGTSPFRRRYIAAIP